MKYVTYVIHESEDIVLTTSEKFNYKSDLIHESTCEFKEEQYYEYAFITFRAQCKKYPHYNEKIEI